MSTTGTFLLSVAILTVIILYFNNTIIKKPYHSPQKIRVAPIDNRSSENDNNNTFKIINKCIQSQFQQNVHWLNKIPTTQSAAPIPRGSLFEPSLQGRILHQTHFPTYGLLVIRRAGNP